MEAWQSSDKWEHSVWKSVFPTSLLEGIEMLRKLKLAAIMVGSLALFLAVAFGPSFAMAEPGDVAGDVTPVEGEVDPGLGIAPISADLGDGTEDLQKEPRVGGVNADGIAEFDHMFYRLLPNEGGYVAIIGGFIATDTPLPARIEFVVPTGSPVFWHGEIAGTGDINDDIQFPNNGEKRTEGDFDIYTATVNQFREVWIEYNVSNPIVNNPDGTQQMSFSFTPGQSINNMELGAVFPMGAVPVAGQTPEVTLIGSGQSGEPIYVQNYGPVEAGQTVSTTIVYNIASGTAQSQQDPLILWALVAIVVLIGALVFMMFLKKEKARR
jgi:hypothetical protein